MPLSQGGSRSCQAIIRVSSRTSPSTGGSHTRTPIGKRKLTYLTQRRRRPIPCCCTSLPAPRPSRNSCCTPIKAIPSVTLPPCIGSVSYTHLRAHETDSYLVCRLLLEK